MRGKTQSLPPELTWAAWHVLEPLIRDAQYAVDEGTLKKMKEAAGLLNEQRPRKADAVLQSAAAGASPHWVAVARANLAALHFERCVRGVAWRLPEGPPAEADAIVGRSMDFDPDTRIEPGDVSVEATLTALDTAVQSAERDSQGALLRHARIARARVAGYTVRCAPNEEVAQRADEVMRADLATLAAQDELTPDLAYIWAGLQYELYSPQAARPFLLDAAARGFDDPSVDLLLASIAIDGNDFVEAKTRATAALEAYRQLGVAELAARALATRGEAQRRLKQFDAAASDFQAARKLDPMSIEAIVGNTRVVLARDGEVAAATALYGDAIALMGADTVDPETLPDAAARLEALIVAANADLELAQVARDAMLREVDLDDDVLRRALRYYFAATLDVALGDYDAARGHAATAETEFESYGLEAPPGVRALLDNLGN